MTVVRFSPYSFASPAFAGFAVSSKYKGCSYMALRVRRSRINELLRARHKKQSDLADRLGVTQGFVSQLATGRASLTYEMAANIADFFKVTMEELADWDEY